MDYTRYLNDVTKARKSLSILDLIELQKDAPEDVVFLSTGSPSPEVFPIVSGSLELADGTTLDINPGKMVEGLQYCPTAGYPPLLKQVRQLMERVHRPPRCWQDRDVIMTPGSQCSLMMVIEMMLEPGTPILLEEPCYTGVLAIVLPYSPLLVGVHSDQEGLVPESLTAALNSCNTNNTPKFLYTVPTGSNPTGLVTSEDRRRQIYQICREHQLLILEDDPYYFLQYDDQPPTASYLSLDEDCRVIRFDSLSKVVSPGLRIGWMTGPRELIEKINLRKGSALLCDTSMTQVVTSQLLESWGPDGFKRHVNFVRQNYQNKRDAMLEAAHKYLKGLCEWTVPAAGMFIWLKVLGVSDTRDMVLRRGMSGKVVVVPGNTFMLNPDLPCQYVRVSFTASPSTQVMVKGLRNLVELIKREVLLQETHAPQHKEGQTPIIIDTNKMNN